MNPHRTHPVLRAVAGLAIAVAAVSGVSACSSSSAASSAAQGVGQHMSAGDFTTAIAQPGTVVIDVRTPAEYASGHLSNAQNIDFDNPDFGSQIATLDKSKTYALYCHSGRRSGLAMQQMADAGFTHVYDLNGGIGTWTANGGQLVTG